MCMEIDLLCVSRSAAAEAAGAVTAAARPQSPHHRRGSSDNSVKENAMAGQRRLGRRSFLVAGGAGAAVLLSGGSRLMGMGTASAAPAGRLHRAALAKGLRYGSSAATWQVRPDADYAALYARESGMLLTEDDLLWYRLKPPPDAPLDF